MAKAGARKDPVIRKTISDLLEVGLTVPQIADKLGYSPQRIYKLKREITAAKEPAA